MKKLHRSDPGIDYVKLLAGHAERLGGITEYEEQVRRQFGEVVQASLTASAEAEHRLRGLRVEALFRTVVVAIGKVVLIKEEDAGDVFYSGADLAVPDYRLVTQDGRQLLVEVKSVTKRDPTARCTLSSNYVQRLLEYSSRMLADLRIATFWQGLGIWTLNRLDSFIRGRTGERQWRIDFPTAFATNEMIDLGDYLVATAPPLRIRILIDASKSEPMPPDASGGFRVTLSGIQIISQDRVLTGQAARVALKLLWYGTWREAHQEQQHDGERVSAVDHVFAPPESESPEGTVQGLSPIGFLSELISRAYLDGAAQTIHTDASGAMVQPGTMTAFIPDDFMRVMPELPLAVCRIQPNFEFSSA